MPQENQTVTLTVKLRLRDKHAPALNRQARSINVVWNYLNETQRKAVTSGRKWLGDFDFMRLTAGAAADLGLHSHSIQCVCRAYHRCRVRDKKPWLRWRSVKSLGWVPFNTGHVSFDGEAFKFNGIKYHVMHLRDLITPGARFGAGSFNADSKGRWYINIPVEVPVRHSHSARSVGVDLGVKSFATTSDGEVFAGARFLRENEAKIATLQRAKKTKRAKAVHAKVANRRKDFQHKASASLCSRYGLIAIGDVSSERLAKTPLAKSVLDAGWSAFKNMIRYKAMMHGRTVIEVPEAYTTQSCSTCGSRPPSRPKGIAGLRIREWTCDDCGSVHDRDVNAARNILRLGLETLEAGVSNAQ